MSESDSAILNSTVTEEEGEGEEGSSAPASNQHTLGMQPAQHLLSQCQATNIARNYTLGRITF